MKWNKSIEEKLIRSGFVRSKHPLYFLEYNIADNKQIVVIMSTYNDIDFYLADSVSGILPDSNITSMFTSLLSRKKKNKFYLYMANTFTAIVMAILAISASMSVYLLWRAILNK